MSDDLEQGNDLARPLISPSSSPTRRVPFRLVVVVTVSIPLLALVTCVVYSLLWYFPSITATHCHVTNWLPSISAATGALPVCRAIWTAAIVMHTPGRVLAGVLMQRWWQHVLPASRHSHYECLVLVAGLLYSCEVLSLLGLSVISSYLNFPLHKTCFILFIVSSQLHMLVSCSLSSRAVIVAAGVEDGGVRLRRSRQYKRRCWLLNASALIVCVYSYWRHNARCEPGMYTLFAASELLMVASNMAFHVTAYWDLYHVRVCVPVCH